MHNSLQITYSQAWAIITGEAGPLVDAGIVEDDKLPGRPHMPRGMVVLDEQGNRRMPGAAGKAHTRIVAKKTMGKVLYEVWRRIGEAQALAGLAAQLAEEEARAPKWPFPVVVGGLPS